jgi:hypothetical protein
MTSNKVKTIKLPYEVVETKVWELTCQVGTVATLDEQLILLDEIDEYIQLCGWTIDDWREETLRRVDNNWVEEEDKSCLPN